MKLKNKIYTLLSVFTLVGLTHSLTLKELNASLTPPTTYNINYSWDSASFRQELGLSTIGGPAPVYTRTASGSFFNYTTTINNSTHSSILPLGLEITMTFNHSNTNWTSVSGGFIPTENKIGSDNTVGTVLNKNYFLFSNQTNKDYLLFFDISSSPSFNVYNAILNSQSINNQNSLRFQINTSATLIQLYIPSFSTFQFSQWDLQNISYYFDAWYLRDLGVNTSYNNGFDLGQAQGYNDGYSDGLNNNPNILLNGFQAMVGILVNFVLMIVNLEVFGVSILDLFAIVVLFTGIVWVLKLIRG
jgi:hypothetical protein